MNGTISVSFRWQLVAFHWHYLCETDWLQWLDLVCVISTNNFFRLIYIIIISNSCTSKFIFIHLLTNTTLCSTICLWREFVEIVASQSSLAFSLQQSTHLPLFSGNKINRYIFFGWGYYRFRTSRSASFRCHELKTRITFTIRISCFRLFCRSRFIFLLAAVTMWFPAIIVFVDKASFVWPNVDRMMPT